jgi:hypothetical protein
MLTCPHCETKIVMRQLSHPGLFKNFRICPNCNGKFTPDLKTKYRQAICIFLAIVSLVLTIMLHINGTEWLIPAVISYLFLGLLIYWGNKHIFLVPYGVDHETNRDT